MKILITSIGSLSAESAIKSLGQMPHGSIYGCNSTPANWLFCSTLVKKFYQVPPAVKEAEYLTAVLAICQSEKIHYLVPLTDLEVDLLDKHRDQFNKTNTVLCIPEKLTVALARNKLELAQHFNANSYVIPIPSMHIKDWQAGSFPFPLTLKPISGRSSEGLCWAEDQADLAYYLNKHSDKDYLIQPKLTGCVWVVDIVRKAHTGECVAVSRKELTRTLNGAGLTVETLYDEHLIKTAKYIAQDINLNGCMNIEFLVTTEKAYLMDINPRFSAGIEFSKIAGYDMPTGHLSCFSEASLPTLNKQQQLTITRHYKESIVPVREQR